MPSQPKKSTSSSKSASTTASKSYTKIDTDDPPNPQFIYGVPNDQAPVAIAIKVRPAKEDVCVSTLRQKASGQVTIKTDGKTESKYAFDYVFPMETDNHAIWASIVKPCVAKLLKGINSAVFAYGGTGSGKSFTMGFEKGGPDGQLQYAVTHLFKKLKEAKVELCVYMTFIEIYGCSPGTGNDNAHITDLLSKDKQKVTGFDQTRLLSMITHVLIKEPAAFFKTFDTANEKRQVGSQGLNSKSSRSHGIVQVMLAPKDFIKDVDKSMGDHRGFPKQPIPWAKMSVIDLAGSEPANLWYSKSDKALMHRYNEAVVINHGLGALKSCMSAMAGKAGAMGNKNSSMLTKILGDLLDKKTKGFLRVICTINPISKEGTVAALSKGTLEYAKEIKAIKIEPGVERDLIAMQKMMDGGAPPGVVTLGELKDRIAPHLGEVTPEMAQKRAQGTGKKTDSAPAYIYDNGCRYTGGWLGNLKHGKARMDWPDGATFEGEFANDHVVKGKFNHVNGDVYDGTFKDGMTSGTGKYNQADGSKYSGGWNEDKKHGKGKEEWTDGSKYEGSFVNGLKSGKGNNDFGNGCSYKGDFLDNMMHGKGKFVWPDKSYDGDWKNGMMHGKGIFLYPDGKVYEGQYKENVRHGKGKLKDPTTKTKYSGGWKDGKQHGEGYLENETGQKTKGKWSEGRRV